ncbi:hypothetical protein F4861DRAFT_537737 [Xylaria intraflava]|nr:hypothetical protein F4861DRAFT_537737 [Xylaria intraflava]
MAYPNELAGTFPAPMKWQAQGPRTEMARQQCRRQSQRPPSKSQPFDPDDLCRRLHVVIAEREAQNKRRQRGHAIREHHPYLEGFATTTTTRTTWALSETTAHAERPSKPKSKPSLQERLRHKAFSVTSSAPTADTNGGAAYRHVPDQAAAQFSRTTTATSVQNDSEVHGLSVSALRFYSEGVSSTHHEAIETSITPGKQRNLLQRARSQRERQRGRNQFQDPSADGDGGVSRRRSIRSGPGANSEMTIVEDLGVSALADLHLHAYTNQGRRAGDDGEMLSSEETLIDAATANEHRVDWTQQDEMPPQEKRGVRLHPLLRKTTSILTLNGKLGKNSGKNKLRVVTIREDADADEQGDVEADDGSTPVSPGSRSSRYSVRASVWSRLKRG